MAATISKGTLNLRFMQNARHAEQDLQVESTETAATKDESQWEVTRDVKDMWGITSEPSSSLLVTHEVSSYLPFVLSRADASGSPPQPVKVRGRRTWNKRGQEVIEAELPPDDSSRPSSSARLDPAEPEHYHPTSKRLTSISSFGPGSSTNETKRAKPRSAKSVRELISEAPSDIREIKTKTITRTETEEHGDTDAAAARTARTPPPSPSKKIVSKIDVAAPPAPLRFLKPAGVDDPSDDVARRAGSRPAQQRREAGAGADSSTEHKTRHQNPKRERDDRHEAATHASSADSRKRKKRGAAAAAAASA